MNVYFWTGLALCIANPCGNILLLAMHRASPVYSLVLRHTPITIGLSKICRDAGTDAGTVRQRKTPRFAPGQVCDAGTDVSQGDTFGQYLTVYAFSNSDGKSNSATTYLYSLACVSVTIYLTRRLPLRMLRQTPGQALTICPGVCPGIF